MRKAGDKATKLEWLGLIVLFLLAGTLGHDPWKQDETYSFGIIYHFFTTHSWLVPMNAGTAFMEKPPLYYWTAVVFCKLLGGLLPLHDAARLASTFYMFITCASVWAASQVLFEDSEERCGMGRAVVALLLGTLGLTRHAHDMFTDMALLSGMSVAMLGLALLLKRPQGWARAGAVLGLGVGVAFLSKGLLVPIILGASGVMLLVLLPATRSRRTVGAVLVALLAASPFLLLWPIALNDFSHELFMEWFWQNNVGRFLGFSVQRLGADNSGGYMFQAVLWFAFPTLPLALATLCRGRRDWRNPAYILPALISVIGFSLMAIAASARALYLLPLLPAFALLGVQALVRIPERALGRWNLSVRVLASIMGLIVVALWLVLLHPAGPHPFSHAYRKTFPLDFVPDASHPAAYVAAIAIVVLWLASLRLPGRGFVTTAYVWLAAIALPWCLSCTLLMPWFEQTRSFRPVLSQLSDVISRPAYANDCVVRRSLGESLAPMWEYFGKGRGLGPAEDFDGASCRLLLTINGKSMAAVTDPRWHLVWKGSRVLDTKDDILLFERN